MLSAESSGNFSSFDYDGANTAAIPDADTLCKYIAANLLPPNVTTPPVLLVDACRLAVVFFADWLNAHSNPPPEKRTRDAAVQAELLSSNSSRAPSRLSAAPSRRESFLLGQSPENLGQRPQSSLSNRSSLNVIPPVGKLTLIFTDIQSSTVLWNRDTKNMRSALRLHHTVLRQSLSVFKAYEVKTEGDAFMIATWRTLDALNFCTTTQMKLLEAPWHQDLLANKGDADEVFSKEGSLLWKGLRVRMGMHTGEPFCEQDQLTGRMDYFGPPVNQAARIAAVAFGGEIVMNSSTYEEIRTTVEDPRYARALVYPVTVEALGEYELKGFEHAEILFHAFPAPLAARREQLRAAPRAPGSDEAATGADEAGVMLSALHPISAATTALQDGAVAVVFTEVVETKELWEEHPEAMLSAMRMHNVCLRRCLARLRGQEVRAEADAFQLVLPDACTAVEFCLTLQKELLDLAWPPEVVAVFQPVAKSDKESSGHSRSRAQRKARYLWRGLKVRMAIVSGDSNDVRSLVIAERDPETMRVEYFGPGMDLGHALVSLALGGEVLCTTPVREGIAGHEELLISKDPVIVDYLGPALRTPFSRLGDGVYRVQATSLAARNQAFAAPVAERHLPRMKLDVRVFSTATRLQLLCSTLARTLERNHRREKLASRLAARLEGFERRSMAREDPLYLSVRAKQPATANGHFSANKRIRHQGIRQAPQLYEGDGGSQSARVEWPWNPVLQVDGVRKLAESQPRQPDSPRLPRLNKNATVTAVPTPEPPSRHRVPEWLPKPQPPPQRKAEAQRPHAGAANTHAQQSCSDGVSAANSLPSLLS
eukprot:TRINITY_DN12765_c0_g1_i1.p1 TRINITY_DN12765_c0_g1~~TRINITY_DN12765_c0_g1_i1.p1  ORF type:complete len:824 (-),score=120.43 TRINITY_DN12765_c0_g1_i1:216-2687(-)